MEERIAFPNLTPQTFKTMNRGDMFFPKGHEVSTMGLAALAAPFAGSPMNVHAIPFQYTMPKATARPQGPAGMATPSQGVY